MCEFMHGFRKDDPRNYLLISPLYTIGITCPIQNMVILGDFVVFYFTDTFLNSSYASLWTIIIFEQETVNTRIA